ncbi:hypothetical protein [Ferrovibrio terrae]|uniref:hypothetical protein n=1 Tax=Ferrovibrio terrae TaxID=2594003 RepID=UPI00313799BD
MGRTVLKPIAALTLLGALAACGPPLGWQKPGVTLAEANIDSSECAALARNQAFRESTFGPSGYYGGYYGPWPYRYGPYGYRSYDSFMWRSQRESDLQDFCLRARGYHLAPIPQ